MGQLRRPGSTLLRHPGPTDGSCRQADASSSSAPLEVTRPGCQSPLRSATRLATKACDLHSDQGPDGAKPGPGCPEPRGKPRVAVLSTEHLQFMLYTQVPSPGPPPGILEEGGYFSVRSHLQVACPRHPCALGPHTKKRSRQSSSCPFRQHTLLKVVTAQTCPNNFQPQREGSESHSSPSQGPHCSLDSEATDPSNLEAS